MNIHSEQFLSALKAYLSKPNNYIRVDNILEARGVFEFLSSLGYKSVSTIIGEKISYISICNNKIFQYSGDCYSALHLIHDSDKILAFAQNRLSEFKPGNWGIIRSWHVHDKYVGLRVYLDFNDVLYKESEILGISEGGHWSSFSSLLDLPHSFYIETVPWVKNSKGENIYPKWPAPQKPVDSR